MFSILLFMILCVREKNYSTSIFPTFNSIILEIEEEESEEIECEESERESDVSEDEFSSANESDGGADTDHWYVACA